MGEPGLVNRVDWSQQAADVTPPENNNSRHERENIKIVPAEAVDFAARQNG